jgi:hypothetical protein
MTYYCTFCNYKTDNSGNFSHHKKSKKHLILTVKKVTSVKTLAIISSDLVNDSSVLANMANKNYSIDSTLECPYCKIIIKHKSSFSRHKKACAEKNINNNENKLLNKIEIVEKEKELLQKEFNMKLELEKREKELYQKLEKEKSDLLSNFMENANTIINKAQDNTKVTAEAMKSVSMSAIKYANDKFQNTPALLPLENFNINNLDFNNEEDKKQLVEILIYNAKQKSLDKLLGDHIVKNYKKDNPEEQSFHTTDCSRLNYIVRDLIKNAISWSIDKNGIKICSSIIKPLIKKCIDVLLEHQKLLLQEMGLGSLNKQKDVELIIDVLMSIDSGSLETDINKYIAPYFNLNKNLDK